MQKIGHITFRYKPLVGGAETYLASLYQLLEEEGYRQHVYQTDTGVYDVEIISVKKSPLGLSKLIDFNFGLLGQYHKLRCEDTLIVNYPEHFFPVAWHKNTIVLSHGATWTHETNAIRRNLRKFAADFSFRFANKLVANDSFFFREMGLDVKPQQDMFQKVAPGKWFIPNCVNTKLFTKTKPDTRIKDTHAIVVPRNFTHARGVFQALQAFAQFNKMYPETTLVLVGDAISDVKSSIEYKKRLLHYIDENRLHEKVMLLGSVPWADMPSIYSASSMTFIPTLYSEGTSLSALESMSCGVATLSTGVEGLLDLPTEKCTTDIDDMVDKMCVVYENRNSIANQQQQIVRDVYNLDNWKKAWLTVINE